MAAIIARSSAFSLRALIAISRTTSNSSRVTRLRSASQRSTQPFMAVSASLFAPCATPMALVISRDMSSKKRLGPLPEVVIAQSFRKGFGSIWRARRPASMRCG